MAALPGTQESLSLYMFHKPRERSGCISTVIPRFVDDYLTFLEKYPQQEDKQKLANPVWHIHSGAPPAPELIGGDAVSGGTTLSFSMLAQSRRGGQFRGSGGDVGLHPPLRAGRFTADASAPRCAGGARAGLFPRLRAPAKQYRMPDENERAALLGAARQAGEAVGSNDAGALQDIVYDVGRTHFPRSSRASRRARTGAPAWQRGWFETIYQITARPEPGPRFGSFIALYGVEETRALIAKALAGDLMAEHEAFLASRGKG